MIDHATGFVFPKSDKFPVSDESAYAGFTSRQISDMTATVTTEMDVSPVQQGFAEEVDINNIIRRFGLTGQLPLGPQAGFYADLSEVFDYESAVARVQKADDAFMTLPPELRERFDNDPGKLVEYVRTHSEEEFNSFVKPPEEAAASRVAAASPVVD